MKKIYKYPIEIADVQTLRLPVDAEILTVQIQNDQPFLWATVNSHNLDYMADYKIWIFDTGHPITNYEDLVFINTIQQMEGRLVWHVFKEKIL
jgi:hypothetical protein